MRLDARVPLTRREAGHYETEDGSVRVVRVATGAWLVVVGGTPIPVGGIREFSTLREAHGALADARDAIQREKTLNTVRGGSPQATDGGRDG